MRRTEFRRLEALLARLDDDERKLLYRRATNLRNMTSRARGQQLKDTALLDIWQRDGSAAYIETLCDWT